ncbi:MAG TPA: hypothetical protein VMT86_10935 [Bryobacteraceae bacterium]|nr:hypothetical protein [Bryobacteraceae bacterium]
MRILLLPTAMLFSAFAAFAQTGPGPVVVHTKFGGQIFGFDIDQNGTEGVLSESKTLVNGTILAAVETFDQTTGEILDVVASTDTQDDFVTMGVVGNSVGLVEHEHVTGIYVSSRTFKTINPLSANKLTGTWTPPIGPQNIIMPGGVSRNQGVPKVAVFAYDNSGNFMPLVFSANVAANTFGPVVAITDSLDFGSVPPPIAYNSKTNQAFLGGGDGCFGCFPVIGVANLTPGSFTSFRGIGFGFVNGIAVDPADDILCTDTEDDAGVEFYDLATHTASKVTLPGSGGQQIFSGADVEFDSVNNLFLVAQPVSSSSASGSTIYVYDTKGNVQETLNGFTFSNASTVVAMHIALHPANRSGYVDGPGTGELQSFTY